MQNLYYWLNSAYYHHHLEIKKDSETVVSMEISPKVSHALAKGLFDYIKKEAN